MADRDSLSQNGDWTVTHAADAPGHGRALGVTVRGFALEVLEGPQASLGWQSSTDRCGIGSHPSNDLVIEDPSVSRFHCEVRIGDTGPVLTDLDSRNGCRVDGVHVQNAWLRNGSTIRLGRTVIRFGVIAKRNHLALHPEPRFGNMVGASAPMRIAFAKLARVASSDATVLLEGETGTGKEEAAIAVHENSPRAAGPFVVIDCAALPRNLLERELFGHEPGAFTGATERRAGAFEEACGGTVFLDEIGELPIDMQPSLLRVLERRTIRRLGSAQHVPIDVRILAATHRDLRTEVSADRFREDLYYRLAVIRVRLPALRERPEDIPNLARALLRARAMDEDAIEDLVDDELIGSLCRSAWPGNVRELKSFLERCVLFGDVQPIGISGPVAVATPARVDASALYDDARRSAIDAFEHGYAIALLDRHDWNVSKAAQAAGIGRAYLHKLMRKHGIGRK